MIQGAIKTILTGDVAIAALVGTRVYPAHAVQEPVLPMIVYKMISNIRELTHSGNTNVASAIYQISCFGSKQIDAYNLAKAVVAKMHGYKGTVGADKIHLASIKNEVEFFDEDAGSYQVAVDVRITYSE